MGDFGYIFGYALSFTLFIGFIIGDFIGYHKRKSEEPKDLQKLIDEHNKLGQ